MKGGVTQIFTIFTTIFGLSLLWIYHLKPCSVEKGTPCSKKIIEYVNVTINKREQDQDTVLRMWGNLANPMRRLEQMYAYNDREKILNADIDIIVYWRHKYQKVGVDKNGLHYWINYNLPNLKKCGKKCNIWLLFSVNIYFIPMLMRNTMRDNGVYFIEQYLIGQILMMRRLYRGESIIFSISFDDFVENTFWEKTSDAIETIRKEPPTKNFCLYPKTSHYAFPLVSKYPILKTYPTGSGNLHIFLGFYNRLDDDYDDAVWFDHTRFFEPKYFHCKPMMLDFNVFYGQRPNSHSNTNTNNYQVRLALAKDVQWPTVEVGNVDILNMPLGPYL
jgi:hypothetical protein